MGWPPGSTVCICLEICGSSVGRIVGTTEELHKGATTVVRERTAVLVGALLFGGIAQNCCSMAPPNAVD